MSKARIDVDVDTTDDELGALKRELSDRGLTMRVLQEEGPGGGWPEVEVEGDEETLRVWLVSQWSPGESAEVFMVE